MSGEPGRQIRVTIPVPVFEQIDRTAAALGISVNELGGRCVVEGVGPAIVARIGELERSLVALKAEIAPAPPVPAKEPAPVVPEEESTASGLPDRKPGRAERAAAERSEQLAEERRRGNRRTRSNGKEATA